MSASKTILVSGANGQLGQELQRLASSITGFRFVFLTRNDLPVEDEAALVKHFKENQPAFFINCAAYTAVDKAESEPELAYRINAEAVGNIASICQEYNTRFIHISTDYVFDGNASEPYTEDAPVNPQSVYGASKLEGERLAMTNDPSAIIIRTSWVYSEFGKNFVKTMLRLFNERGEIGVVNDQLGSPTYAADLAGLLLHIIASGQWHPGLYHFSNEGVTSWYHFANEIKELSQSSCFINPITTAAYPTPAKRPAYSALNTTKIQQVFGIRITKWDEALANCLKRISQHS